MFTRGAILVAFGGVVCFFLESMKVTEEASSSDSTETSITAMQDFTVLSTFSGGAYDAWAVARSNHEDYCSKHGYTYIASHTNEEITKYLKERRGGWAKISMVQEAFSKIPEGAHVFWMDGDSLFMNKSISLQDFVAYNRDIVISGDFAGLNTGHFLIRNTKWSRSFLDGVWKIFPALWFQYEQSSFAAMLAGANPDDSKSWLPSFRKLFPTHPVSLQTVSGAEKLESFLSVEMRSRVQFLVQSRMNSGARWKKGEFIYHVSGGSGPAAKEDILQSHASMTRLLVGSNNGTLDTLELTKVLLEEYAKLAE